MSSSEGIIGHANPHTIKKFERIEKCQTIEKVLPAKGFGGKDSWKGKRQGSLSLKSTTF